jgi:hypothetical protein
MSTKWDRPLCYGSAMGYRVLRLTAEKLFKDTEGVIKRGDLKILTGTAPCSMRVYNGAVNKKKYKEDSKWNWAAEKWGLYGHMVYRKSTDTAMYIFFTNEKSEDILDDEKYKTTLTVEIIENFSKNKDKKYQKEVKEIK